MFYEDEDINLNDIAIATYHVDGKPCERETY